MKKQHLFALVFFLFGSVVLWGQNSGFCPKLWFSFSDTVICTSDTLHNIKVYSNTAAYGVRLSYTPGYRGEYNGSYPSNTQLHAPVQFSKINDSLYVATFPEIIDLFHVVGQLDHKTFEIHALLDLFPADNSSCTPLPFAFFTITYRQTTGVGLFENPILCNGQSSKAIELTSGVDLVYDEVWTNDNPNIGLAASGKNVIPSFVATNTTGRDQIATIHIKVEAKDGRNVCPIPDGTITIKVTHAQKPTVSIPPSPELICYGDTTSIIKPVITHDGPYTLRWKIEGWVPAAFPVDTGRGNFPAFVADNSGNGVSRIVFRAETNGQCISDQATFDFIYRPKLRVDPIEDRWFCNGAFSKPITFPGREYNVEFRWSMSPILPGLPEHGLGNIPTKLLSHSGDQALSAQVKVRANAIPQLWWMSHQNEWHAPFEQVLKNSDIPVAHPHSTALYVANAQVTKIKVIPHPLQAWLRLPQQEISLATPVDTLLMSEDGNSLYAINQQQGIVYKIITTKNQVETQANLQAAIRCSALSPDGQKLYFAMRGQTTLRVLGTQTLNTIETINMPGRIESMLPFPDGTGLSLRFVDSLNIGLWEFASKRVVARFEVSPGIKFYANAKAVNKLYIYDGSAYPIRITAVNLINRALDTIIYPDIHAQGSAYEFFPNQQGDLLYLNTYPVSYLDTYQNIVIQDQYFSSAKKILLLNYYECETPPQTFKITLGGNPLPPKIELPLTQTLCPAVMSKSIPLNDLYPGIHFRWAKVDSLRDINTAAPNSGYGTIPSFRAPISDHNFLYRSEFKLYPSFKIADSVCIMPSLDLHYNFIGSFRAYGIPDVPNQLLTLGAKTQTVNLGAYANEITRLKWQNDNPSIGLPANGVNDIPSVVAKNPSNTQTQVANFKISREIVLNTDNICKDTSKSFQIRVMPFAVPSVDSIPNITVCYGDSIPLIQFKGSVAQAKYRWRVVENPGYGLNARGENTLPRFRAFRGTGWGAYDEQIKIAVTPVAQVGQDSSVGKERQFTILIRSKAVATPPTDQFFCHNEHVNLSFSNSFYVFGQFSKPALLTPINPVLTPLNYIANNPGVQPDSGIFKIWVKYIPQSCPVDTFRFEVKVYPRPVLPVVEQYNVLCSGTQFAGVNFSSNVCGFDLRWSNSNPNIGLPASGQGSIPAFLTKSDITKDESAVIRLSVFAQGTNQDLCDEVFSEFNIRVISRPRMRSLSFYNTTLNTCSPSFGFGFSSDQQYASYRWTNSNPALGGLASGEGTYLPPFTPINTSDRPQNMLIKVTPLSAEKQCEGKSDSFRIVVLPQALINKIPNQDLCWGQNTNPVNFGRVPDGAFVHWELDQEIGLPLKGIGNIPAFSPKVDAPGHSFSVKYQLAFAEQLSYVYRSSNGPSYIAWFDAREQPIILGQSVNSSLTANTNFLVHPSGRFLYSATPGSAVIEIFDPLKHSHLGSIGINPTFSNCTQLNHVSISLDGHFIYISKQSCPDIQVIDTRNNAISRSISTSTVVGALTLSQDGSKLYVLSENGRELIHFDALTGQLLQRINVNLDAGISDCHLDPGTEQLFVLNQSQKKLYRLSATTGDINVRLNLSGEPSEIKVAGTRRQAFLSLQPGGIYSFDPKASTIVLNRVRGTNRISAFSLSTDEETLYAAQPVRNNILKLRTQTATVIDSIAVALGSPVGLALIPAQGCSAAPDSFLLSFKDCLQDNTPPKSVFDRKRINPPTPGTPQEPRLWENVPQSAAYILGQNTPNPFQGSTQVPIYAPYAGKVQLYLYDVMGRVVKLWEPDLAKGWSEVQLSNLDLPHAGVYSLVLKTKLGNLSRKVVVLGE